jgi:IS5 family transposase
MSQLTKILSQYWAKIQGSLFPWLEEELDPLTKKQQQLIAILELVRIEEFLHFFYGCEGRPQKTRSAIARSFVAKMVYNMDTTTLLIERLKTDKNMRRICGWESITQMPSESTFSRAFADFAKVGLPQRAHKALIQKTLADEVILHNARDSTAIEAREKPQVKSEADFTHKNERSKRGRPKKGEERPAAEPTRIEKQKTMTLEEMLNDLPTGCGKGAKKDSKGNTMYWTGYKLHLDTVDGGIPVSAIVTSASVHDSQVAIPLATLTAKSITNCYDLMDAGYDVSGIIEHSLSLGHVPLIDKNPRRNTELQKMLAAEKLARRTLNWDPAETFRYNSRSMSERSNSRLKDEFGASKVRVRGGVKVTCHLMFGVLVLAADQLMKLVT